MYAEVSNKIYIHDYTADIIEWCDENLVLKNPEYEKKKRMGLWVGNTPRQICLYEKISTVLAVPFGCLKRLHDAFPDMHMVSRIRSYERISYRSGINLYGYQKDALQAATAARNGIVVMPCGSGKTQTALELVNIIGGRCLWLTHTQDLLNQSMERAKSVLEINNRSYGTITGGKVNIGTGITFATVQTMSKLNLEEYRDVWDIIIVDECHKCVGGPTKVMQFYKVLSALSCRYKFGLTATPKRSDGLEKSMYALLGDVVYTVSREDVSGTTCPVEVKIVETGYMPDLDIALCGDGTINYAGLVNDLTHNDERFEFVLKTIQELPAKSPILVLGNRVEYLQNMCEKYSGASQCLSGMGNSKKAKEERRRALKALNDGDISCLFATYQLAKEGLDVPNLRYVVFATPEKDESTVVQAAGRVARKADGKDKGTVIDFVDNFGMLLGWAKKRHRIFEKKLNFMLT